MMELSKYLDQTYAASTKEFRKNGGIVLSPSGIGKFFNEPNEWYLDRIGETTFDGNTYTVLGNALHGAIDAYWHGDEVTEDEVVLWIQAKYSEQMVEIIGKDKLGNDIPKVDMEFVAKNFMPMFIEWVSKYATLYPKPDLLEEDLSLDIQKGMIMAGTLDGYEIDRGVLIDYKTAGRMPGKDAKISESHRLQLSAYAFMMIAAGYEVNTIRIVYLVRPTKTIGARIKIIDEELDEKTLLTMVETVEMMKESWNVSIKYPELTKILFRPNRIAKW